MADNGEPLPLADNSDPLNLTDFSDPIILNFTSCADAIAKYHECAALEEYLCLRKEQWAEKSKDDEDIKRMSDYYKKEEAKRIDQKKQCFDYLENKDIIEVTTKKDLDPVWETMIERKWGGKVSIAGQLPDESNERKEAVKQAAVFIDVKYLE